MRTISHSIKFISLGLLFCAAMSVKSNADKENVAVNPNQTMIDCLKKTYVDPIKCINDLCPNADSPLKKANCYSACSQKISSNTKNYTTCMTNSLKSERE